MPGSTTAVPASVSTELTLVQYLVQSITTAALQHCPARLVPPPRESTGTPWSRQTATAFAAASGVRGHHHADGYLPIVGAVGGICRAGSGIESDLSVHALAQIGGNGFGRQRCSPAASLFYCHVDSSRIVNGLDQSRERVG